MTHYDGTSTHVEQRERMEMTGFYYTIYFKLVGKLGERASQGRLEKHKTTRKPSGMSVSKLRSSYSNTQMRCTLASTQGDDTTEALCGPLAFITKGYGRE